jgi:hypothetical protein
MIGELFQLRSVEQYGGGAERISETGAWGKYEGAGGWLHCGIRARVDDVSALILKARSSETKFPVEGEHATGFVNF